MLSREADKKDCGLFQDLRKEYDHAVERWKKQMPLGKSQQ